MAWSTIGSPISNDASLLGNDIDSRIEFGTPNNFGASVHNAYFVHEDGGIPYSGDIGYNTQPRNNQLGLSFDNYSYVRGGRVPEIGGNNGGINIANGGGGNGGDCGCGNGADKYMSMPNNYFRRPDSNREFNSKSINKTKPKKVISYVIRGVPEKCDRTYMIYWTDRRKKGFVKVDEGIAKIVIVQPNALCYRTYDSKNRLLGDVNKKLF